MDKAQNTKISDFFQFQRRVFPSPLGEIALGTGDHDLVGGRFVGQCHFPGNWTTNRPESARDHLPVGGPTHSGRARQWPGNTAKQPAQFFVVMLQAFSVTVAICSGTPFQRAVWTKLLNIAQGIKRSCDELAAVLGKPEASRAIEHAVERNPVGVIVSCHQVPGSNGQLTGNVSGREGKRALLTWGSGS